MSMATRVNPDNAVSKRQRFKEEVEEPMDMMHGQEGLAFWSYWEHQSSLYILSMRLLATRPGGRVERYLSEEMQKYGRRHRKSREDLAKYITGTHEAAIRWRMTREGVRHILKRQCMSEVHFDTCYCPKCFGMTYVKGHPTMIMIRIKAIIYELRQFGERAQQCLFDMLLQSDIKMWDLKYECLNRPCDAGTESCELPLQDAKRKFEKYNYYQEVDTSMALAELD